MWEDSSYCWVVTCKNHLYHIPRNFIYKHKIPLGATDGVSPLPNLKGPFRVCCDMCGKMYVYRPSEVTRMELELPSSFVAHPLFREGINVIHHSGKETSTVSEGPCKRALLWEEEVEVLFSLLDCVIPQREAVYASSEVFTGKRFYDLCLDNEARTADELQKKLGDQYRTVLLRKNTEKGLDFATRLRDLGHKTVLMPAAFNAGPLKLGQNWSGKQYKDFWSLVVAKKCHIVYMNEGWQFSEACVFDYLSGVKAGKRVLDHVGNPLILESARKMLATAVARLEEFGFEVPKLHDALVELKSFSSLG